MKIDFLDWEVIAPENFPTEGLIPVKLNTFRHYIIKHNNRYIDTLLSKVNILSADVDQNKIVPEVNTTEEVHHQETNYDTYPNSYCARDYIYDELILNIPQEFSEEFYNVLSTSACCSTFERDAIEVLQEILGVRFMKLILLEDKREIGGIIGYIYAMNHIGEGNYIQIPWVDGLAFTLSHKNVPIFAHPNLFETNGLRARRIDFNYLNFEFGIESELPYFDILKKVIYSDIKPNFIYVLSQEFIKKWGLKPHEISELITYAIELEKYEWAKFLEECLEVE